MDKARQLTLSLVHKIFYGVAPAYLSHNFTLLKDVHNKGTRGQKGGNFYLPKASGLSQKTFYYNGIKEWNCLPNYIKQIECPDKFKEAVKLTINANSVSV